MAQFALGGRVHKCARARAGGRAGAHAGGRGCRRAGVHVCGWVRAWVGVGVWVCVCVCVSTFGNALYRWVVIHDAFASPQQKQQQKHELNQQKATT